MIGRQARRKGIDPSRLDRRQFLGRSGTILGAAALGVLSPHTGSRAAGQTSESRAGWDGVRNDFDLSRDYLHFAAPVLASHPKIVRDAIQTYREALDSNTKLYLYANEVSLEEGRVLTAAGEYLQAPPEEIALTDSTTMGLGTMYAGLNLREGDEVLTTTHDFYSTHEGLRFMAAKTGAIVRRISLYDEESPASASRDGIIDAITAALTPRTRVVAITWVHSSSGVKLPVADIAAALRSAGQRAGRRILLCVDGVHGFGAEDDTVGSLRCDIFISGCHKWLFGPRGTGIVWAAPYAWRLTTPSIPSFHGRAYLAWLEGRPPRDVPAGRLMTPGGFHSFEHRWALAEAFEFHGGIGKFAIAERTHSLATQLKEGLSALDGVDVLTPMDPGMSSGIVCFNLRGVEPEFVVETLERRLRVVASITPYRQRFVRFMTSIVNSPDEIEEALLAIRTLGAP